MALLAADSPAESFKKNKAHEMGELTQDIFGDIIIVSSVTSYELIIALVASALLNLVVAKIYTVTHGGYSYSKSFVQTIVVVGITVTLIMVIIGSDIARAFALVGAMSIVRFRTPVKDSRDLVFVFAAIAIGMACGTQYHVFALIFTVFLAAVLLGFYYSNFGELPNNGYVVKLRIKPSDKDRVSELCRQMCQRHSVVSISRANGDDIEDVIYELEMKRGISHKDLLERLSTAVEPLAVNILVGEGNISV